MAVDFGRDSSYYVLDVSGSDLSLPDSDWCIGFWVRAPHGIAGHSAYQYIISAGGNVNAVNSINIFLGNNSNYRELFARIRGNDHNEYNSGSRGTTISEFGDESGVSLVDQLVVMQRRSGNMEVYLVDKNQPAGAPNRSTAFVDDNGNSIPEIMPSDWWIGSRSDGGSDRWFANVLSEFFVLTDGSLAAPEVEGLATGKNIAEVWTTPAVNLRFIEADETVEDLSGNGHHAIAAGDGSLTTAAHPFEVTTQLQTILQDPVNNETSIGKNLTDNEGNTAALESGMIVHHDATTTPGGFPVFVYADGTFSFDAGGLTFTQESFAAQIESVGGLGEPGTVTTTFAEALSYEFEGYIAAGAYIDSDVEFTRHLLSYEFEGGPVSGAYLDAEFQFSGQGLNYEFEGGPTTGVYPDSEFAFTLIKNDYEFEGSIYAGAYVDSEFEFTSVGTNYEFEGGPTAGAYVDSEVEFSALLNYEFEGGVYSGVYLDAEYEFAIEPGDIDHVPSAFYGGMAATAARLINRFGAPVVLVRKTGGKSDPITGEVTPELDNSQITKGILKRFPDRLIDGTRIMSGDRTLILDSSVEPLMTDRPRIGGKHWVPVSIETVDPAGLPLVYFVHCRR